MRTIALCCLALSAWGAQAQSVNLRGLVANKTGKPVANAIVSVKSIGLKDTSSADGSYSIVQSLTSVAPASAVRANGIALEGGALVLDLSAPSSLRVELLDLSGKLLNAHSLPDAGAGRHYFPLAALSGKGGVFLVRISVGGRSVSLRALSIGREGWTLMDDAGAARALVAVDTLVTSADGYATTRQPISSYDQNLDIVLDTALVVGRSAGCDKTAALANGTLTIQSGGKSRKYILKIPSDYDKNKPYRLVFAFAESGSSAQSVANRNYFRMAGYDSKGTIFVAPDAENGAGSWSKADVTLTDDILAKLKGGLCIDTTRIFATGFSFGGAMSLALACTRADVFRGVAFFSGADLTGSCPSTPLSKPIAYYASQASGDASGAPIPTSGRIKQAQFAAVNGCTEEPNATTFPAAGKAHTCTVYKNCKAGYPTVYCVFNGAHGWEPNDPGQSTSWNPPEAWKFIAQF